MIQQKQQAVIKSSERGSMLVLSSFILLALSLLTVSYWKMVRVNAKALNVKKSGIQAYYASRGGIEDAIAEIKAGTVWGSDDMSPQWNKDIDNTYYKSTEGVDTPLTHFDVPTKISVTVSGNPEIETVNITSVSEISMGQGLYSRALEAKVVKSLSGEVLIIEVKEK